MNQKKLSGLLSIYTCVHDLLRACVCWQSFFLLSRARTLLHARSLFPLMHIQENERVGGRHVPSRCLIPRRLFLWRQQRVWKAQQVRCWRHVWRQECLWQGIHSYMQFVCMRLCVCSCSGICEKVPSVIARNQSLLEIAVAARSSLATAASRRVSGAVVTVISDSRQYFARACMPIFTSNSIDASVSANNGVCSRLQAVSTHARQSASQSAKSLTLPTDHTHTNTTLPTFLNCTRAPSSGRERQLGTTTTLPRTSLLVPDFAWAAGDSNRGVKARGRVWVRKREREGKRGDRKR